MPDLRPAFVFDGSRCTACEACRIACGMANNGGRDIGWRQVLTFNPRRHPARPTSHLSLACNHCDDAPCLAACPAGAYRRDEATGAVLLEEARCLGCRYCSWVCPYDAPRYDQVRGVMSKCTFCADRLAAGREPACTLACPTGALSLGERGRAGDEPAYPGLAASGLGPALRVVSPAPERPPSIEPPPPPTRAAIPQPSPPRKIRLASEWGLLVFTQVMPALVAWFGAGLVRPALAARPSWFLGLGAAALAASALHLGRPSRGWRALANLRRSPLSREVLCVGVFLASGTTALLLPPGTWPARAATVVALLAGAAVTVAVDAVYHAVPSARARRLHSAEAVLAAPFLLGVAAGLTALALATAAVRAGLFVRRWGRSGVALAPPLPAARLLCLAAACAPGLALPVAVAAALAGDGLDRASFYAELEPTSPAALMAAAAGGGTGGAPARS